MSTKRYDWISTEGPGIWLRISIHVVKDIDDEWVSTLCLAHSPQVHAWCYEVGSRTEKPHYHIWLPEPVDQKKSMADIRDLCRSKGLVGNGSYSLKKCNDTFDDRVNLVSYCMKGDKFNCKGLGEDFLQVCSSKKLKRENENEAMFKRCVREVSNDFKLWVLERNHRHPNHPVSSQSQLSHLAELVVEWHRSKGIPLRKATLKVIFDTIAYDQVESYRWTFLSSLIERDRI